MDDLRESPAVEIAHLLAQAGAQVKAYEPFKPQERFQGFETVATLEEALQNAELIALLVGHQQFRSLQPQQAAQLTTARLIVDAVNGWPADQWSAAGFIFQQIGVGSTKSRSQQQ